MKSGAVSPAFTSVVDSASVSAPFLALRLPHEGSSRMTAMIAAISASITHSDLLLFLVAIVLQFYQRSDLLSGKDLAEVARGVHVEDDDPEAVLAAEREGREVHDLQTAVEDLLERDFAEFRRRGVLLRVGRIDAVHAGALQHHVGLDLDAAQRRRRVGREVGIRRAAPDDHHVARFEVFDGTGFGVVFADGFHADRGEHLASDAVVFERRLERQRVDDRGEHAHLVALHAVEALFGAREAAEDVAAADDDADLDARCCGGFDLLGVGLQHLGGKPVFLSALQRFAAQFQEYSLVFHRGSRFIVVRR